MDIAYLYKDMCLQTNKIRESLNNFALAELCQLCCAAFSRQCEKTCFRSNPENPKKLDSRVVLRTPRNDENLTLSMEGICHA